MKMTQNIQCCLIYIEQTKMHINVKVLGLSLIIDAIIQTRSSLLLVISYTRPTVKDNRIGIL
jgi:hypothetical protein